MQCPVCPDTLLVMTERQGIEIDYCPKCRGVWLDRGELDKLIERSVGATAAAVAPSPQRPPVPTDFRDSDFRHERHPSGYGSRHKKSKSWLSELFDD